MINDNNSRFTLDNVDQHVKKVFLNIAITICQSILQSVYPSGKCKIPCDRKES